jgi:organic radical activating enzyme
MRMVRQQLLQGQAPKQCQQCVKSELHNGSSFRLTAEMFHPELSKEIKQRNDPDYFDLQNITITTSNLCNLKCLPCHSSSYVRHIELKKLGLSDRLPQAEKAKSLDKFLDLDFKRVTMLGGEPFYDMVTFDFLEKLAATGKSKHVSVDLNTNMTSVTDQHLMFLSQNFKETIIKASIDGLGPVNEYLRYPSSWSVIEKNLQKLNQYSNISYIVTTALSNLSLLRYHEIINWAAINKINLFITIVNTPALLRPDLLPLPVKSKLLEIYQDLKLTLSGKVWDRTEHCIDTCIQLCSTTDYSHAEFQEFLAWIKLHDDHRGQSMISVFPELVDYV